MKDSNSAWERVAVMDEYFDDASVEGWEYLENAIVLPDKNDAHIAAAAICGRADVIVTSNIKDFPKEVLEPMGIDVQTPDEFLLNQLDLDPDGVIDCLKRQSDAMNNPEKSVREVLELISRCGAERFAAAAGKQLWRID